MKTRLIIFILSLVLTQLCYSQVKPDSTILLADETTLNYTKTEAVIKCSNESVFNDLYKSHSTLFKRWMCSCRKNKTSKEHYYIVYLNKDDASIIEQWAKTNL